MDRATKQRARAVSFLVDGFVLIFAGFVIFAIIAGYLTKKAAERRQAELLRLSQELGLDFMPNGFQAVGTGFWASLGGGFETGQTMDFLSRFQGFRPFGIHDDEKIKNLLLGRREDRDLYAFDYSYTTTSTDSHGNTQKSTHSFGIVAVRLPIVLPPLTLSPENVLHKVGQLFGKHELTFELEEFNRRYFVECVDRQGAYDILHPRAIEYLMSTPVRLWQMAGMFLLIHKNGSYAPEEIRQIFSEMRGFLELLPDYVKQDRGFAMNMRSALDG